MCGKRARPNDLHATATIKSRFKCFFISSCCLKDTTTEVCINCSRKLLPLNKKENKKGKGKVKRRHSV